MKPALTHDLWSGLLLIGVGAAAIVLNLHHPMGTAARMGPAYFPVLLGGLLILFGLAIGARSVFRQAPAREVDAPATNSEDILRYGPLLLVTLSVVSFGVLIERVGLVVSVLVLVAISALSGRVHSLLSACLLGICLSALVVVIFVYLLQLPIRVWPL